MSEVIAVVALALWITHAVAAAIVMRRRERWIAAHNYIQGYTLGQKHGREGLSVIVSGSLVHQRFDDDVKIEAYR